VAVFRGAKCGFPPPSRCLTLVVLHPSEIPLARAASLFAARRYAEAAGAYRAALSIDPTCHRAHLGLADCSVGRGVPEEAVEELVGAAADFRDREQFDAAFALLARALAIDPAQLELHIDVAELEAASGRMTMAIDRLRNLAAAYEQAGRDDEAVAVLEVVASWSDEPTAGAPEWVRPSVTEPALVVDILKSAPPPPAPAPQQLLVRPALAGTPTPVLAAATESVLLRKAPPPPPPPRVVRSAGPQRITEVPAAKPVPPPPQATPRRASTRRDSAAPRWRPSPIQGRVEDEPARSSTTTPRAAAEPRVSATPRSAAKPATAGKTKAIVVAPAPSPSRGAVKLDKLPALKGPVPPRDSARARGIPKPVVNTSTAKLRGVPQPVTTLPPKGQPAAAALGSRPSPRPGPAAPARPAVRADGPSLAQRLRQTSAGPAAKRGRHDFEDEEPTRLWAPDGLLL
jgi:hypothetical protein